MAILLPPSTINVHVVYVWPLSENFTFLHILLYKVNFYHTISVLFYQCAGVFGWWVVVTSRLLLSSDWSCPHVDAAAHVTPSFKVFPWKKELSCCYVVLPLWPDLHCTLGRRPQKLITIFTVFFFQSEVLLTLTFGKMLCAFSFGCFQIYQDKRVQQLIF